MLPQELTSRSSPSLRRRVGPAVSSENRDNVSLYLLSPRGHQDDQESLLYECVNSIQQQYRVYEYEYKKNYKSWGRSADDEMMTNKEYMLIWEWFRDTLMGVRIEEGVVLKTLVYYCVTEEVFGNNREAFSFFEPMHICNDKLLQSFTELIKVMTSSPTEQGNKLRAHIKGKHRRRKGMSKPHPHMENGMKTSEDSVSFRTYTGTEESSSLRSMHKHHLSSIEHDARESNTCLKSSSADSGRRSTQLPAIPNSKTHDPHSSMTQAQTRRHTASQSLPTIAHDPKEPAPGRIRTIGRVIRRQLSRLASLDAGKGNQDNDNKEDDEAPKKTKNKREKNQKKRKGKKKCTKKDTEDQPFEDKADKKPEGNLFTTIGRNVRIQLNRLASLGGDS